MSARDTSKTCTTHAICVASDSRLPECRCWCAECKEYRRQQRRDWTPNIRWVKR